MIFNIQWFEKKFSLLMLYTYFKILLPTGSMYLGSSDFTKFSQQKPGLIIHKSIKSTVCVPLPKSLLNVTS